MATPAKEIPWVDAWVRWERNSMEVYDADDAGDSDDEQLPPPTESYAFTYSKPALDSSKDKSDIKLELKGYHDDSEQTWNSTGLTMWRSSHHLCQYLVSEFKMLQDTSLNDLRILEVGSGLGRCGLLAHRLSHENATTLLTDGDTDVLKQLRENVKNNTKEDDDNISCTQLLWGEAYAKTFLSQQQGESKKFDVILGSDLIYVKSVIRPLFETVRVLLSEKEGSQFLMAHCSRREGNEVELNMVLDVADEEGFLYEILIQEDSDISVFSFRRKE